MVPGGEPRRPPPKTQGGRRSHTERSTDYGFLVPGCVARNTNDRAEDVTHRELRRRFLSQCRPIPVHSPENRGRFLESAKLLDKRGDGGFFCLEHFVSWGREEDETPLQACEKDELQPKFLR